MGEDHESLKINHVELNRKIEKMNVNHRQEIDTKNKHNKML